MKSFETAHSDLGIIEKKSEVELINLIKHGAETNISEKLPFLLPREETEIVFLNDCPEQAFYYGKWGKRHIIGLRVKSNEESSENFSKSLTKRLTHELIHQRFAEIAGIDKLIENHKEYLQDINVENLGGQELCKLLNKSFENNPPKTSNKLWGIAEAVSFMGEKYIYEDERPLRNILREENYPKEVLDTIFSLDESVEHNEIPEFLEKIISSNNIESWSG